MTEFEEKYLEELKKQHKYYEDLNEEIKRQNEEYINSIRERERKEEEQQKAITKYGLILVGLIIAPLLLFLPCLF